MASNFTNATTYSVSSNLEIAHSYHFVNHVFDTEVANLADLYKPYKRCLAIVDHSVYKLYGYHIKKYFKVHEIEATIQPAHITEDEKSLEALQEVCSWITDFNILRREPVLVIGGGLVTDVVGFACAIYRRTTRYIRIPTSLIGLIDASVSNRVAVNWRGMKNRLGGYHEPLHTLIDPTFLRTLPVAEVRNGIAEILKISSCTHIATFEALEQCGHTFIETHFGQLREVDQELVEAAETVIRQTIQSVLEVEVPNSREQSLDRVMYFGHTWSPVLELAVSPPLLHGHAVSVDMCFSANLANQRGLLANDQYMRFLRVFSALGLAMDHPAFTLELMKKGTDATIATRGGKLRAPVPTGTLGSHAILQMVDYDELETTWANHKKVMEKLPRNGLGLEMDIAVRA
ncbi:MAG: hypothetical protein Q9190_006690 [Brigantiaea leucoxantha]